MKEKLICPICGNELNETNNDDMHIYKCFNNDFLANVKYEITKTELLNLSFYLIHTDHLDLQSNNKSKRFYLYGDKQACELISIPNSIYFNKEIVDAWMPKDLSERIDRILLYLKSKMGYFGQEQLFSYRELSSIYFVDNCHFSPNAYTICQVDFINSWLRKMELISYRTASVYGDAGLSITILPDGLTRIDSLQKTQSDNKNVFIAMKFGPETEELRKYIKYGIELAGYIPRIMDEIEHNHQIVPEMLYEIRNSRFVIAELTHHNNGAYYEAGYASGLGKQVIHICKTDEIKNGLHFDVAQVQLITYDAESELEEKIVKRIKAIENQF